jgi:hypothetical protein
MRCIAQQNGFAVLQNALQQPLLSKLVSTQENTLRNWTNFPRFSFEQEGGNALWLNRKMLLSPEHLCHEEMSQLHQKQE